MNGQQPSGKYRGIMRTNVKAQAVTSTNHNGAKVVDPTPNEKLERVLNTCLLFEDTFYVDGHSIADTLTDLVRNADPDFVASLAIKARKSGLRHAPLLVARALASVGKLKPGTLTEIVSRPDELGEFLALYWSKGKCPVSNAVKKGLADAFYKFDEHQFAKFDRDSKVKLRDVIRVSHPKPRNEAESGLFKRISTRTLETPDTWEVALSNGADKRETFTRLLKERKLGYSATLKNLRNMEGVDKSLIRAALLRPNQEFPHSFVAADKATNGNYRDILDEAMKFGLDNRPRLTGRTVVLVDVSDSMDDNLSSKSVMSRMEAASALASLIKGVSENCVVYSFSYDVVKVDGTGLALVEKIPKSQTNGGTYMGKAVQFVENKYDRLIVITDEQSSDTVSAPTGKGYIMNLAAYENGVGYKGGWNHVSGFSSGLVDYILAEENR